MFYTGAVCERVGHKTESTPEIHEFNIRGITSRAVVQHICLCLEQQENIRTTALKLKSCQKRLDDVREQLKVWNSQKDACKKLHGDPIGTAAVSVPNPKVVTRKLKELRKCQANLVLIRRYAPSAPFAQCLCA